MAGGGVFDRTFVRSIKRCLKNIPLGARIAFEKLQIVLHRTELTLNNWPLTTTCKIGDEFSTPSRLLILETVSIKITSFN